MQTNPLPAPVAAYFANELRFTEDSVVLDEKHEHRGPAAIAAWNAAAIAKYNATSEPLRSVVNGDVVSVTAKVTGTFPGSPIELQFHFTLQGDLISRLEIQ